MSNKGVTILCIIILLLGVLGVFLVKFDFNKEGMVMEDKIYFKINDKVLSVSMVDNTSSRELINHLKNGDITVHMEDYSNFEKVGNLGFDLPRNDERITTTCGDVILYLGNQITIYYDKNTYNFTKLGHIDNIEDDELKSILGSSDVEVTISLNGE